MNTSNPKTRRPLKAQPRTESLESRELLTAGAGDTFAIVPGTVAKSNQPADVKFTLDTSHFTFVNGRGHIGIDVATPTGSSLKPKILSVTPASKGALPATITRAVYDPTVQRTNSSSGPLTSAVVARVGIQSLSKTNSISYNAKVTGTSGTTGGFLLGYYLPGDANGDGKVDKTDLAIVKSELGAKAGTANTKYTFDADANRDGKITMADVMLTRQNMGMTTNISPVVSANLDPSSTNGSQTRVTTNQDVKFTGTATPGAAVKYTEVMGLTAPVATTADSNGNYTLVIPLGVGSNTFNVSTQDAFGQSINGTIAPVTYVAQPTGTAASGSMTTYSALTQAPTQTKSTS